MEIRCARGLGQTDYCGYNCVVKNCQLDPQNKCPVFLFKNRGAKLAFNLEDEFPELRNESLGRPPESSDK